MKENAEKIKLIIADDHPVFRSGLETVLKSMSIVGTISQASDGEEILQLLSHEHYDIVLMDVSMKPMNGIEATEIIAKRFPDTKVIALSMHEDAMIIMDILDKGAVGYLIKNADTDEIRKAIDEVMGGKNYYSAGTSQLLVEYNKIRNISKDDHEKDEILKRGMFRDVLFLVCNNFSSKEIGDILNRSTRTIDNYRNQLKEITGQSKVYGFVRYAVDHGVLDDEKLRDKFAVHLSKKKK